MKPVNGQIAAQFPIRLWEQIDPSVLRRPCSLYLDPEEEGESELKGSCLGMLPLFTTFVDSIARHKPPATCFRGRNLKDSKSFPNSEIHHVT
jgi:hypothetical protein